MKTETWWVIKDKNKNLLPYTARKTRKECIYDYDIYGVWGDMRKCGISCVKITVTEASK